MEKRLLLSVKLYEENNKLNAERVCAFFLKTTKTRCLTEENNLYRDYLLRMKGRPDNDMVVLHGLPICEFGRGYLPACLTSELDVIDVHSKTQGGS